MGDAYAKAGVSIEAGDEAVRRIRSHVASTNRPEVLGGIGGFGGLFAFDPSKYASPVLVSATDGVGTKLEVARATGNFSTVGIDLVAMCVDDLACSGAEPLFFLDYLAVGALDPQMVEEIVTGVAAGCRDAGCALVGGETAEHPGVMANDQFDLAGFAVGVVDRGRILDGSSCRPGDTLVGLGSPGLRSNGYSLARKLIFEVAGLGVNDPCWDAPGAPTVGEELLRPSVIYAGALQPLLADGLIRALAHITGGGITGNLPRSIPNSVDAVVRWGSWPVPRIFDELQRIGDLSRDDLLSTFNMGLGMIAAVSGADARAVIERLGNAGIEAHEIGELVDGTGMVRVEGLA